jgi:hypothetical protein
VLHLLHYIPMRRAALVEIVEDIIPLYNLRVAVKVEQTVARVVCVPQGLMLPFVEKDGYVEFEVPCVRGHQMVAVEQA